MLWFVSKKKYEALAKQLELSKDKADKLGEELARTCKSLDSVREDLATSQKALEEFKGDIKAFLDSTVALPKKPKIKDILDTLEEFSTKISEKL